MTVDKLAEGTIVAGSRATLKAIEKGQAEYVFFAADAEKRVLQPILDACAKYQVKTVEVATMGELGKAARLQVATAAAARLHD